MRLCYCFHKARFRMKLWHMYVACSEYFCANSLLDADQSHGLSSSCCVSRCKLTRDSDLLRVRVRSYRRYTWSRCSRPNLLKLPLPGLCPCLSSDGPEICLSDMKGLLFLRPRLGNRQLHSGTLNCLNDYEFQLSIIKSHYSVMSFHMTPSLF